MAFSTASQTLTSQVARFPSAPPSWRVAPTPGPQDSWSETCSLWLSSQTSPHTRRAYQYALKRFLAFTGKPPRDATRIIRLSKSTHAQGPILCNLCGSTFEIIPAKPHPEESWPPKYHDLD